MLYRDSDDAALSLTAAQREIWLAEQRLGTPSGVYQVGEYVRIEGPVDRGLLEASIRQVVGEVDAVHVRYVEDDHFVKQVVDATTGWRLPFVDLRGEPDPLRAAVAWMHDDVRRPMDLAVGPLFSYALLQVRADCLIWYHGYHHIAMDAIGAQLIARRVAAVYTARAEGRPVDGQRFGSLRQLVADDDAYRASQHYAQDRAFWTGRFADLPEPTRLFPPSRTTPTEFIRRTSWVSPESLDRMRSVARRARVPASQMAIAACAAYMHRVTGADDVVLGLPLGARTSVISRATPGTASNILPLRVAVRPDHSTGDLLRHVSDQVADAAAHQGYRGEDLHRDLRGSGPLAAGYAPVINVMSLDYDLRFGAHRASVHNISSGLVGDLAIAVWNRNDGRGLQVDVNAHSELCTEDELAAHQERFIRLLDAYAETPTTTAVGRLDLLDRAERSRLLAVPTLPATSAPPTLAAAFEAAAAGSPAARALSFGDRHLTYAELDTSANRLAHRLIAHGVGPEDVVGLVAARTPDTVIALLAILKAGAAYLPLDPAYPPSRLAFMLADARPALLVGDRAELDTFATPAGLDVLAVDGDDGGPATSPTDADRSAPLRRDHPAYVIYTSGSTGRPKGVVVTHHNALRLFDATRYAFVIGGDDVWTLFHSLSFDFSVWELWGALLHGGRLVVVPYEVSRTPSAFLRLLADERVTVLNQTPSAFHQLIEADRAHDLELALRLVVFGGEALQPERLRSWFERHPDDGPELVNMYGITETTVHVTLYPLTAADAVPPTASVVGGGLSHLRVRVLDPGLQPVPTSGVGEVYVAGEGVARGYLVRPGLTAVRFVADPTGPPGSRMYRSGDLARVGHDGALEYLGRSDDQVKIRGFRIELGEIESVLARQDGVAHAAVIARTEQDDTRLVAYVVPADGAEVRPDALRDAVRASLPDHMVPAAVVAIDQMPITPNGKLDRAALPAPITTAIPTGPSRPCTPDEEAICAFFAEILGVERIGPDDNFFDLGGHSVLATRLSARLRTRFGVEVGLRALFESPTPSGIARRIGTATPARRGLTRVERPDPLPLSFAQRRLWFLHQLDETAGSYNIPFVLRLTGTLDRDALQVALDDVAARHESLRTVFPDDDGLPRQVVRPAAGLPFQVSDADEATLPGLLAAAARHRFDLAGESLIRAELFAVAPDRHVLLLLVHHIVADGWSITPLAADLAIAYEAHRHSRAPEFSVLSAQYADYTVWQQEMLGEPSDPESLFAAEIGYWTAVLADLPECVTLPTDRPRPSVASHRGDHLQADLHADLHADLLALAREYDVSLFMVFVAGLAGLLARLGAGDDVPIGTPVVGRDDEALEDMVGLFVNTLVLRVDTSGEPTFAQLLGRVRERALAAYSHQEVPFEHLVDVLQPTRSLAHHPLFQVNLALRNSDEVPFSLAGLDVTTELGHTGTAKFDLFVDLTEQHDDAGRPAGVRGLLEYAADLFDPASIRTFWSRLTRLLGAAASAPDAPVRTIDVLDPAERRRVRSDGTGPALAPVVHALPVLARERLAGADRTVLLGGDEAVSGAELDTRANRLAHLLRAEGVQRSTMVALSMERSVEAVVAILAVLKAGGAYVPLDRRYPPSRIAEILDDIEAGLVLTRSGGPAVEHRAVRHLAVDDPGVRARLAQQPATDPAVERSPDDVAYVMYTSGSTGRPKGIAVTDANVAALALDPVWDADAHQRVLLHSPLAFDASTYELWVPLLGGGQVVVAPDGEFDAPRLAEVITRFHVTGLWLTAALFDVVAEQDAACFTGVRQVWAGGEALPPRAVARVLEACPTTVVVNGYGPTETTTFATSHPVHAPYVSAASVPIGRPLAGHRIYVLDRGLQPVAPAVPGELYIAGAGLARGYLHQPGLTAHRFVADPFGPPGTRMYRTGDLVRWTSQCTVEFLGRADDQVKIRGFRIEPAEIEAGILAHPGELTAFLEDRLPRYMVPAAFVRLPDLPLTANSKLDRAALPDPYLGVASPQETTTPREKVLCDIFAAVLTLPGVGPDDDFFALGGDSITSIRLVSQARRAGLSASVRDVFEGRTPARLARTLEDLVAEPGTVEPEDPGLGTVEPTPIMCWLRDRGDRIDRFYQSMLLQTPPRLSRERLVDAAKAILDHHDMLRARVTGRLDDVWELDVAPRGTADAAPLVTVVDVAGLDDARLRTAIGDEAEAAADRLSATAGTLVQIVLFDAGPDRPGRLLVLVHHLAVDGVSWHILVPDLVAALSGEALPAVGTSFAAWSRHLRALARDPAVQDELARWCATLEPPDPLLTDRPLDRSHDIASTARTLTLTLPAAVTEPLLTSVPTAFHAGTQDVLLTGLSLAVGHWRASQGRGRTDAVLIDLEGHGRNDSANADLSRTVGWFTVMHPVRLEPGTHAWNEILAGGPALGRAIKRVKEQLRALPAHGRGFGLLRHLDPDASAVLAALPAPQVGFNYLGRFAAPGTPVVPGRDDWRVAGELDLLGGIDDAMPLAHGLEIDLSVRDHPDGPRLTATWSWASGLWDEAAVRVIAEQCFSVLRGFVDHGTQPGIGGHSPSDFPLIELAQHDIERLEAMWGTQQ